MSFLPIFNQKTNDLFADMDQCGYLENSIVILEFCREFLLNISCGKFLSAKILMRNIPLSFVITETMLAHNARAKNVDIKQNSKRITQLVLKSIFRY